MILICDNCGRRERWLPTWVAISLPAGWVRGREMWQHFCSLECRERYSRTGHQTPAER